MGNLCVLRVYKVCLHLSFMRKASRASLALNGKNCVLFVFTHMLDGIAYLCYGFYAHVFGGNTHTPQHVRLCIAQDTVRAGIPFVWGFAVGVVLGVSVLCVVSKTVCDVSRTSSKTEEADGKTPPKSCYPVCARAGFWRFKICLGVSRFFLRRVTPPGDLQGDANRVAETG